ncbi:SNF2-related protein [Leptotrichia wadei]|uniref:SNF2-related protein n=1 Tax=Leptotrichia wadei TaxID=157687 RepID=UPI0028D3A9D9|nr:SNF2-related protein [Leptotrichia wadei]
MEFKAHNYQKYCIEKVIKTPNVGLLLDMGLGKTIITLTAIDELKFNRFEVDKVLIIAPKKVAESTWLNEAEKWNHLKYLKFSRVLGSEKKRITALNTPADIYVINRENVQWLVEYYKNDWPFDMVVIDEFSSFKNHTSKRFKALKLVLGKIDRVVGLTGTPAPNGLKDIWAQIYLLDKGERLGKNITAFRERYFDYSKYGGNPFGEYELKEGSEKSIMNKISDICVSMKAEDYLELPDITYNTIPVELDSKSRKQYEELEKQMILELNESEEISVASAAYGLNLQDGGNHVIWFGLNWSLELYQQANKRLHRQGQKEKVIIHHLVTQDTRDEDVMKALQSKGDVQEELLQSLKARIEKYKKEEEK